MSRLVGIPAQLRPTDLAARGRLYIQTEYCAGGRYIYIYICVCLFLLVCVCVCVCVCFICGRERVADFLVAFRVGATLGVNLVQIHTPATHCLLFFCQPRSPARTERFDRRECAAVSRRRQPRASSASVCVWGGKGGSTSIEGSSGL
jgi:hypothetical protein